MVSCTSQAVNEVETLDYNCNTVLKSKHEISLDCCEKDLIVCLNFQYSESDVVKEFNFFSEFSVRRQAWLIPVNVVDNKTDKWSFIVQQAQ